MPFWRLIGRFSEVPESNCEIESPDSLKGPPIRMEKAQGEGITAAAKTAAAALTMAAVTGAALTAASEAGAPA